MTTYKPGDEPLSETYDVVSEDPEIQALHVCVEAIHRHLPHPGDADARRRIGRYLAARFAEEIEGEEGGER